MNAEERARYAWNYVRVNLGAGDIENVVFIREQIKQAEQAAKLEGIKQHFSECEKREKAAFEKGRKEGLSCPGKEIEEAYLKGQREMREKMRMIAKGEWCHPCGQLIADKIRALSVEEIKK